MLRYEQFSQNILACNFTTTTTTATAAAAAAAAVAAAAAATSAAAITNTTSSVLGNCYIGKKSDQHLSSRRVTVEKQEPIFKLKFRETKAEF
jgi:hypothetical protein